MIKFLSRLFRRKHTISEAFGNRVHCWCGQRLYMNPTLSLRLSCLISKHIEQDHAEIGLEV